eukprot:COSAG04_NODE_23200_length_342_cov_0.695473_1_plen_65_part_00
MRTQAPSTRGQRKLAETYQARLVRMRREPRFSVDAEGVRRNHSHYDEDGAIMDPKHKQQRQPKL